MESFQSLVVITYPRRLLLHSPLYEQPAAGEDPNPASQSIALDSGFDANAVMILAVLLCAIICALGLNSIVRCALQCSGPTEFDPIDDAVTARVANTNTGVKKKALRALPTLPYSAGLKLPASNSDCVICLSEFTTGDWLRVLPKCNHGFHVKCIDRWLMAHSSCPTCRQCLFNTHKRTSRCAETSPTVQAAPQPTVVGSLEPEGIVS